MRVVLAGASGYLGSRLSAALSARGHSVVGLVRGPARGPGLSTWDPYAGVLDAAVVRGADVVVNLAGSPLLGNPYSTTYARTLRDSRVLTTRLLADTIAGGERGSLPALVAGNGSSYYGDHGRVEVTEDSASHGDDLLTRITREWEAATHPARDAGARVCVLRTAPVLGRRSATMKVLVPLFKAGLGARLGPGSQYFPVVSPQDWVAATTLLVESPSAAGAFNVCCPRTPTNAEFTRALASLLHRPALLAVPRFALRLGAGPMAGELLRSLNLSPAALHRLGYQFRHPDVHAVLAAGMTDG